MLRHRWLDRSAEERVHLHVLPRPLRGSGFALGQPDRLRRQAHLELRLADVAARDHPTAGNPISAIRSKPNKKRPSGTKPEGLNKA